MSPTPTSRSGTPESSRKSVPRSRTSSKRLHSSTLTPAHPTREHQSNGEDNHDNPNSYQTGTGSEAREKTPAAARGLRDRPRGGENGAGEGARRADIVGLDDASTGGKRRADRGPSGEGLGAALHRPIRARRGRAAARVAGVAGWQLR